MRMDQCLLLSNFFFFECFPNTRTTLLLSCTVVNRTAVHLYTVGQLTLDGCVIVGGWRDGFYLISDHLVSRMLDMK